MGREYSVCTVWCWAKHQFFTRRWGLPGAEIERCCVHKLGDSRVMVRDWLPTGLLPADYSPVVVLRKIQTTFGRKVSCIIGLQQYTAHVVHTTCTRLAPKSKQQCFEVAAAAAARC